jgi:hypothetical protein
MVVRRNRHDEYNSCEDYEMKLVVIMSVDAYADMLERVYTEHRIPVFSEMDIQGFRLEDDEDVEGNWFARGHASVYSKLTFAFVSETQAAELLEAIADLNSQKALSSPIRAFQLAVEKAM